MSYITSNSSKGVLSYEDAGYVIEIEDEEYYNQSTSDSKYLHLDGSQAMTSNLDMGSNKITNVVDPTDAQEASTKNYIDSNYYDQSTSDNRYLLRIGGNTMSDNLVFESGATVILNDFAMDAQFNQIKSVADPTSAQDATNLQYLQNNYYDQSTSDGKYLHLDGSQSMSSNLDIGSNKITNVANPTSAQDATNLQYLQNNYYNQSTSDGKYLHLDGSQSMSSNLDMGSNKISSVVDPSTNQDVATKNYVDSNHYNQSTADNKYLHLDGSKAMTSDLDMGNNNIINAEQMIMREVSINDDSYFTIEPISRTSGKLLVILDANIVEVMYDMTGDQYVKVSELGSLFSTFTGVSNGSAGDDNSFNLFFDSNAGNPRIHLENRTGLVTNARYCVYL